MISLPMNHLIIDMIGFYVDISLAGLFFINIVISFFRSYGLTNHARIIICLFVLLFWTQKEQL